MTTTKEKLLVASIIGPNCAKLEGLSLGASSQCCVVFYRWQHSTVAKTFILWYCSVG